MVKLSCETEECVRAKLASNKQFAEILEELGVVVPTKISPATGKETFALAKGDQGFLDLCEHEDAFIQQLCTVRLGTKSTIEESRIERFIGIGARNRGKLPIPLKYYGAHTGRWAGADKVNFQNLPARDKKKKALKNAVIAPDGYKVINADSSQIEARVLVWLAGQDDVVQWYKEDRDVYCEFASTVYDRPITKANKTERAVGKTCILGLGYGTGWAKLQQTLKLAAGVTLDEQECKRLVSVYRNVNSKVIDLWRECEEALRDIASWPEGKQPYAIGRHNALYATPEGIKLPNGLYIKYPGLTWDTSEAKSKYVYKSRRGFISIWGGSVVENVVQALARIIIGEQMLIVNRKYRPVLTVHDAVVNVVPENEVNDAMEYIINTMSTPPDWATGLPVACEAHFGDSYGDC
jgi:DNA polymerase